MAAFQPASSYYERHVGARAGGRRLVQSKPLAAPVRTLSRALFPHPPFARRTARRRGLPRGEANLLSDRGAYISFLEMQLERVTAATMAATRQRENLDAALARVAVAEERLVRETQRIGRLESELREAAGKIERLEGALSAARESVGGASGPQPPPHAQASQVAAAASVRVEEKKLNDSAAGANVPTREPTAPLAASGALPAARPAQSAMDVGEACEVAEPSEWLSAALTEAARRHLTGEVAAAVEEKLLPEVRRQARAAVSELATRLREQLESTARSEASEAVQAAALRERHRELSSLETLQARVETLVKHEVDAAAQRNLQALSMKTGLRRVHARGSPPLSALHART